MPGLKENFKRKRDTWGAEAKQFLQNTSFPGFNKVPVWDVAEFFFREIRRDRLTIRASAISFNFLLALFPSIIFLFTLIPYIPVHDLDKYILNTLEEVLPESGFQFLESTISDIVRIKRGGLLSFGFLLAFSSPPMASTGCCWRFIKTTPSTGEEGCCEGASQLSG